MNNDEAILMFKVLAPIPATKFTAEIQTVLLGNYLKLYAIAKAHDETHKIARDKLVSEGVVDEKEQRRKLDAVMDAFLKEDAIVDLQKISRTQFLAEATKAGVEITLGHIGILEPIFEE